MLPPLTCREAGPRNEQISERGMKKVVKKNKTERKKKKQRKDVGRKGSLEVKLLVCLVCRSAARIAKQEQDMCHRPEVFDDEGLYAEL